MKKRRYISLAGWLCLALLVISGCVTERVASEREQRAYETGVKQTKEELQEPENIVIFQGSVLNTFIDWEEGLTLANGILAAGYVGRREPSSIRIIAADGEILNVDTDALLRGEDYFLKPGDIVELNR